MALPGERWTGAEKEGSENDFDSFFLPNFFFFFFKHGVSVGTFSYTAGREKRNWGGNIRGKEKEGVVCILISLHEA